MVQSRAAFVVVAIGVAVACGTVQGPALPSDHDHHNPANVDPAQNPTQFETTTGTTAGTTTTGQTTGTTTGITGTTTGATTGTTSGATSGATTGAPTYSLTTILAAPELQRPVNLDFHKTRPAELWIVNYLDDSVVTVYNPGTAQQRHTRRRDLAATHFMHLPTAIATGANDTWATCGENTNGGNLFTGPSLFSSDPNVFTIQNTDLGSHLDMLHATPYCMGISHMSANRYFVFNGYVGALDFYDFHVDHGPGADDHSDGEIYRYSTGLVKRVVGVPSHVFFHAASGMLFIADTGNKRIAKLNPNSGMLGPKLAGLEAIANYQRVDGATLTDVVPPGVLTAPSGIHVTADRIYVTDYATSRLHFFDLNGQPVLSLNTGLPANSLTGITVGPDGKIYMADMKGNRILRLNVD